MEKTTTTDTAPTAAHGTRSMPSSRRWLILAVISTVVALLALGHSLGVLFGGLNESDSYTVAGSSDGADTLTIVIGRTPGGCTEWAHYVVLMRYLQEELGVPVQLRYLTDRESAADVFRREEADAGIICTRSYWELSRAGLVDALAIPRTSGATTETAMLLVDGGSPYRLIGDLQGRTIAVTSRNSLPSTAFLYWLAEREGIDVGSFFGQVVVGNNQDENLMRLARGEVDATVGCSTELIDYPRGAFRAIAISPEYALPPFVASTSLDPDLVERMRAALLAFDATEQLPHDAVFHGFAEVEPHSYDFTFELLTYSPVQGGE